MQSFMKWSHNDSKPRKIAPEMSKTVPVQPVFSNQVKQFQLNYPYPQNGYPQNQPYGGYVGNAPSVNTNYNPNPVAQSKVNAVVAAPKKLDAPQPTKPYNFQEKHRDFPDLTSNPDAEDNVESWEEEPTPKPKPLAKVSKKSDSSKTNEEKNNSELVYLADSVKRVLGTTVQIINHGITVDKEKEASLLAAEEQRKMKEKEKLKRSEDLLKLKSLLQIMNNIKMPRFRHVEAGRKLSEVPDNLILKGKQLFRVIAFTVLKLYVKPFLIVRNRRKARRDAEKLAFFKTLELYVEPCELWLGKLVRQPILSIQRDEELNFDPHHERFEAQVDFEKRLMQLKVRIKAIVKDIAESGMPNEKITNFLVGMTDDDNYFDDAYLFPMEKDYLEFSDLGATRNMIGNQSELDPENFTIKEEEVDDRYKRVKLLVRNYLIVRILIGRVVLSPWACGIYAMNIKTSPRKAVIVKNLRMIATILYDIVGVRDKTLPAVPPVHEKLALLEIPSSAPQEGGELDIEAQIVTPRKEMLHKYEPQGKPKFLCFNNYLQTWFDRVEEKESHHHSTLIEEKMIADRPMLEALEWIHLYCMNKEKFQKCYDKFMTVYINELGEILDTWLTKVTMHVVRAKMAAKLHQRPATAPNILDLATNNVNNV